MEKGISLTKIDEKSLKLELLAKSELSTALGEIDLKSIIVHLSNLSQEYGRSYLRSLIVQLSNLINSFEKCDKNKILGNISKIIMLFIILDTNRASLDDNDNLNTLFDNFNLRLQKVIAGESEITDSIREDVDSIISNIFRIFNDLLSGDIGHFVYQFEGYLKNINSLMDKYGFVSISESDLGFNENTILSLKAANSFNRLIDKIDSINKIKNSDISEIERLFFPKVPSFEYFSRINFTLDRDLNHSIELLNESRRFLNQPVISLENFGFTEYDIKDINRKFLSESIKFVSDKITTKISKIREFMDNHIKPSDDLINNLKSTRELFIKINDGYLKSLEGLETSEDKINKDIENTKKLFESTLLLADNLLVEYNERLLKNNLNNHINYLKTNIENLRNRNNLGMKSTFYKDFYRILKEINSILKEQGKDEIGIDFFGITDDQLASWCICLPKPRTDIFID